MRRRRSLRIGVHHANAAVWEPVYRTHLRRLAQVRDDRDGRLVRLVRGDHAVDPEVRALVQRAHRARSTTR
eukprot:31481-Pelagococcus_subviridis.AAC.8